MSWVLGSGMSRRIGMTSGRRTVATILTIAGLVTGLSACGSDAETGSAATSEATSSAQPSTSSATRTSSASSTTVPTSTTTELPVSTDVVKAAPAPVVTSSTAPVVTSVPMPNVVCMNLQDAQDLIQALGVFYSRSSDATGKGRNQVLDANWVVVGQNPDAGVPISEGDAVLSVVKIGETNAC